MLLTHLRINSPTGSRDGTISLRTAGAARPIQGDTLVGTNSFPSSLVFSPDSRVLAAGGNDGKLTLWDPAAKRPIGAPLTAYSNSLLALTYSSDGKRVIAGDAGGAVVAWNVDPSSWEQQACEIANPNMERDEWTRYVGNGVPFQSVCAPSDFHGGGQIRP